MKYAWHLVCFFVLLIFSGLLVAKPLYPFNSTEKQAQFNYLTQTLRCLVCQDENLASSNAKLAADLRQQVYLQVKAGKSNQQIQQYMVTRYGDFVLYKPPLVKRTYFLWFAPFLLLIAGFIILFVVMRRHRLPAREAD